MGPDSAAEIVGRLNAKVGKLERLPTGIPQFTQEDICGAIGFLKLERHRLWLNVAYAHHLDHYQALKTEILTDIVNKFHGEHWDNRPGMISSIIDTAVLEVLNPLVCLTCNGQKSVLVASRAVICDSCGGSGIGRKSDYWRASTAGIHRQLWKRHWRERYSHILDLIRGLDGSAKSALAYYLS